MRPVEVGRQCKDRLLLPPMRSGEAPHRAVSNSVRVGRVDAYGARTAAIFGRVLAVDCRLHVVERGEEIRHDQACTPNANARGRRRGYHRGIAPHATPVGLE